MSKKFAVLVFMFVLLFSFDVVFAVPTLRLPFEGGETWICTQGTSEDPSNFVDGKETNYTHLSTNSMSYAWDFSVLNCSGKPILASAGGDIVHAQYSGNWGNVVIIDYGDGSYGLYGHLNTIDVNVGESVHQGQKIGTCGSTGNSTNPHIHYQTQDTDDLNGESIQSTFSDADVQRHNGIPIYQSSYTSDNRLYPVALTQSNTFNQPIYTAYTRAGGYARLGAPFDNGGTEYVHNWNGITLQDFQHPDCPNGQCPDPAPRIKRYYGDDGQSAIIYNPIQDLAHLVRGGFWGVYKINNCLFD